MTLKLPHEFRPTATKVGRRTYNLAYSMPELDPDLSSNLDEALKSAQRGPVLVEIVGEGCFGKPSFIDHVVKRAWKRGMSVLELPLVHGHQQPLDLLRWIIGLEGEGHNAWLADLPAELREGLGLFDYELDEEGSEGRALRWQRIRLAMELLKLRFKEPTVVTICTRFGEIDHETFHLLEYLFDSLPGLRVLLVLSYDERSALPGIFSRLDSYYIRFIPEIRVEELGEFGKTLQKQLSHEQFAGFLAELTPSRCYAEQLKYYFERDLHGHYDRRLNYPLTPIQLFLSRWQKVNEDQRRLLLTLSLQETPQRIERLSEVSGVEKESAEEHLIELVDKRLCLELETGFVLSDPSFYTWSVDFSDHQLTEELHRRHLACESGIESFSGSLGRLDHLLALEDYRQARLLAAEILGDLNRRAFFYTVLALENRLAELIDEQTPVDEAFALYSNLIDAALELEDEERVSAFLDVLEFCAVKFDDEQCGRLEYYRGRQARLVQDPRTALYRFTRAAELSGEPSYGVEALNAALECSLELDDRQWTTRLLKMYPMFGDETEVQLSALIGRLKLENRETRYSEADETISEIQSLLSEREIDSYCRIEVELMIGRVAKNRGFSALAHEHLETARRIARTTGCVRIESFAQSLIAQVLYNQGKLEEAIERYLESLKLINYAEDTNLRFGILNNLGLIYHSWGYLESALSCIEVCEQQHRPQSVSEEAQTIRYNLAMLWLDLGFIDKSQNYLKELNDANNRAGVQASTSIRRNLSYLMGRIAERQGNDELAERLFRRAVEQFAAADMPFWKLFVMVHLARSLRLQNRLGEGDATLREIEGAVEELGSRRLELNYVRERAHFMLESGEMEEAEERATRALGLADSIGIPLIRFEVYWLLSRIQLAAGKEDEARYSYAAAEEDLENLLADFNREDLRAAFLRRPTIVSFRDSRP